MNRSWQRTCRPGEGERHTADSGFSLIEVLVGMALMAVVTTIFTTGVVAMYRTSNTVDATSDAQGRTLTSFYRLEREVRYAQQINAPRRLPGTRDYAVEYVVKGADSVRQCVQLVLPRRGGDLRRRQWPLGETATTPSTVIAPGLTVGPVDAAHPAPAAFVVHAAGSNGSDFDRLQVYLTTSNDARAAAARVFELQFTALNTVQDAARAPATECITAPTGG